MDKQYNRLGDILLHYNLITKEQLAIALEAQKTMNARLGATLVKLGYVTEDDIKWALSNQLEIPYVNINLSMIDGKLIKKFPRSLLEYYQMIPLTETEEELIVAMADPTDKRAIEEIKKVNDKKISLALAHSLNIRQILQKLPLETPPPEEDWLTEAKEKMLKQVDTKIFLLQLFKKAINERITHLLFLPYKDSLHCYFKYRDTHWVKIEEFSYKLWETVKEHLIVLTGKDSITGIFDITLEDTQKIKIAVQLVKNYYGEGASIAFLPFHQIVTIPLSDLKLPQEIFLYLREIIYRGGGSILLGGVKEEEVFGFLNSVIEPVATNELLIIGSQRGEEEHLLTVSTEEVTGEKLRHYLLTYTPRIVVVTEQVAQEVWEELFNWATEEHLLIITLLARDVVAGFHKLLSMGVKPFHLANSLKGIWVVEKVPKLCTYCRQKLSKEVIEKLIMQLPAGDYYIPGAGCKECDFTGYKDSILLNEYFIPLPAHKLAILEMQYPWRKENTFLPFSPNSIVEQKISLAQQGDISTFEILNYFYLPF